MLILVMMPAAVAAKSRVYVLEPGVYERIVIDDGEVWLGVFPAAGRAMVRECKLRVRKEESGTKVEAASNPQPLFMVKGAAGVKPGAVTSLYTAGDEMPDKIAVTLKDKKYVLETTEEKEADGRRVSRLRLKLGGKQMILGDCGARDSIYPVWAGDLDGDGRLDVYLRIEHHNNAMEQRLFLSSVAQPATLSIRKLE